MSCHVVSSPIHSNHTLDGPDSGSMGLLLMDYHFFITVGQAESKSHQTRFLSSSLEETEMADLGPVLVGIVLFILLQPGLLFQLPGNYRQVEFGSLKTNGKSIAMHTFIFCALYAIMTLAVHLHIYIG
ncbi:hypothetical protein Sango_0074500 [Sesamum angolense]|uniref:Uncharacterized protein n=1 Tax=Sesamum angolense TaxID=2727404 RepID=A0AAE2C622_9LAMI|nr:hypothetical protein Sango_0074500 [Sesamum angolense]